MRETTRVCPKCGNTKLILLSSMNKKICNDCKIEIPWFVEPDQKPIH